MIDKLIIWWLLAALVASGVWGVVHGERRYVAGEADERAKWEQQIAATNALNAAAELEATARREADVAEWAKIAADARAGMIPTLTEDQITVCSTPNVIRLDLNRINVRRVP